MFNLDIDNAGIETKIFQSILGNATALSLIDEFIFEYHVNFKSMLPWWGGTVDKDKSLHDAYQLFYTMRTMGIRSHSWV